MLKALKSNPPGLAKFAYCCRQWAPVHLLDLMGQEGRSKYTREELMC